MADVLEIKQALLSVFTMRVSLSVQIIVLGLSAFFMPMVYAQDKEPAPLLGVQENPENYFITQYDDWELVCEKENRKTCVMAQIGNDNEGTPIMEMRIRKLPETREVEGKKIIAVADILTPLGVMLVPGVELQVDLGPVYAAPFQLCVETGCIVREPLAEQTVKAFKAGSKATISLIAATQGEVRATLSLRGFTRAYNSLK